ncbi:helix-turn-helix transcriptional regulator [Providencia rettgeri]
MFTLKKPLIIEDDRLVFTMLVGREISYLRKEKGLSGAELGRSVGLSQQQISRYERGRVRLDLGLMIYLLSKLDISFNDFIIRVAKETKRNYPILYRKYHYLFSTSKDDRITDFSYKKTYYF